MPASWCPHCQSITMVDWCDEKVGKKLITTVTCRQCHSTLSKREMLISELLEEG